MSSFDSILEDLKSLSPEKLRAAADFIQRLKRSEQEEREVVLARTFGPLSPEEAAELEKLIAEGCEQIDENN